MGSPCLACQFASIVYRNPFHARLERTLALWLTQDDSSDNNDSMIINRTAPPPRTQPHPCKHSRDQDLLKKRNQIFQQSYQQIRSRAPHQHTTRMCDDIALLHQQLLTHRDDNNVLEPTNSGYDNDTTKTLALGVKRKEPNVASHGYGLAYGNRALEQEIEWLHGTDTQDSTPSQTKHMETHPNGSEDGKPYSSNHSHINRQPLAPLDATCRQNTSRRDTSLNPPVDSRNSHTSKKMKSSTNRQHNIDHKENTPNLHQPQAHTDPDIDERLQQTAKLYPSMADSNEAASPLPISDKVITRKMIKRARMKKFTKRKKQQQMKPST